MVTAGIENIVSRYIFPNVNEEGLSPENDNRIREILKGLQNEARSKYDWESSMPGKTAMHD